MLFPFLMVRRSLPYLNHFITPLIQHVFQTDSAHRALVGGERGDTVRQSSADAQGNDDH
jgi:hypothetical protein